MTELDIRIRAVFFDLDETLLDDNRGMRESTTRVCAALGQRYPQIDPVELEATYLQVSEHAWTRFGSVPRASGRQIRVDLWGKALAHCGLPDRPLAVETADLYSHERRVSYRLFPDARELLDALHGRITLGIITNGPEDTQREKVAVTGLQTYLDVLCISGELEVGKPDPTIFRKAMEAAGATPDEALHVGDSLASDIAGAKGAGMSAAWLNRRGVTRPQDTPSPDVEISSLRDLFAVVDL